MLTGTSTPSLSAQGEQRRSSYFDIEWDNSLVTAQRLFDFVFACVLVACSSEDCRAERAISIQVIT